MYGSAAAQKAKRRAHSRPELSDEQKQEIKEAFEEAGGHEFQYIPCLNDDPAHIRVMLEVVRENIGGWVQPR